MTTKDTISPIAVSHRLTDERSTRDDHPARPKRQPRPAGQAIEIKSDLDLLGRLAAARSRNFVPPISGVVLLEVSLGAHPTGRDGRSAVAAKAYRRQASSPPTPFPPTHTYFSLTV